MNRRGFFSPLPLQEDPLRGAYGLAWYERKPTSLTDAEWKALDDALAKGRITTAEYIDWKENVR
jgi:hypothetical protein